ncbi:LPS translocon maturation chaperone LptM [Pararhizobium sp.]|uniref:LPS translocon maturation chaperone LptM n=1 Tax=Pararhizobium sp. TaxID=1977563 RepID=UPI00271ABF60|nr:lipoprotein [Pararhizobium sp.]MDO9417443.1 lipoprotein [Pararhizobium sp.]
MTRNTVRVAFILAVAGLALAGCGRKGPLETPARGQSLWVTPEEGAVPAEKPDVEDKPFLLDPLL